MTADGQRLSFLFVNQYYHPDVAATGQHLTDLAEYLVAQGHAVTVFAARADYREAGESLRARDVHNGVHVRRFRTTTFGRATHVGRVFDYLSFYLQVLVAALVGRSYDMALYLTTPPLIGAVGFVARLLRGQPYSIWSMDLHPQAEIAAGMVSAHGAAGRALLLAWRATYRRAAAVIALGEFMQARIVSDGVPARQVRVVPPWSRDVARVMPGGSPMRAELGIGDRFVVMYSGNAGLVHDFAVICAAMQHLREDDRFFFLFVGGGPRRQGIVAYAGAKRLTNFAYVDYAPRGELPGVLASGDAHLISLRPEFAGISVPSKLYAIMAASRPALFVGPENCESAQSIRSAQCGAVIDPAQPDAARQLTRVLQRWREQPQLTRTLGENGRRWFQEHHAPEVCCSRILRALRDATGHEGAMQMIPHAGAQALERST